MFGRGVQLGCIAILISGCGLTFALSSLIERHMVENYNRMTNELEINIKKLDEQARLVERISRDESVVNETRDKEQQETERYSSTLFVIAVGVLVVSAIGGAAITIYILNGYLSPIRANYKAVKSGNMPNSAAQKTNFNDAAKTGTWSNLNHQPSCVRRPKRYKVDMK